MDRNATKETWLRLQLETGTNHSSAVWASLVQHLCRCSTGTACFPSHHLWAITLSLAEVCFPHLSPQIIMHSWAALQSSLSSLLYAHYYQWVGHCPEEVEKGRVLLPVSVWSLRGARGGEYTACSEWVIIHGGGGGKCAPAGKGTIAKRR